MSVLQELLQRFMRGELRGSDDVALLLLVLAVLLSLTHLLTMLATRWGDRHTAFKSFVASVLMHCVCFFSFQIFSPFLSAESGEAEREVAESDLVIEVLPQLQQSETAAADAQGSIPLADRPNQLMPELERLERAEPTRDASVMPERESGRQGPITTTAQTVTQFESRPMEELEAPREAAPAPAAPDAADPAADLETIFESSLADLSSAASPRMAEDLSDSSQSSVRPEPDGPREAPALDFAAVAAAPSIATLPATSPDQAMLALPSESELEFSEVRRSAVPVGVRELLEPLPQPGTGELAASADAASRVGIRARLPRPSRGGAERAEVSMPERFRGAAEIGVGVPGQGGLAGLPAPRVGGVGPITGALSSAEASLDRDMQLQPELGSRPVEMYQLRSPGRRTSAALAMGGTEESEQAVERSLRWLASVQAADGRWDASDFGSGLVERDETGTNREFAGREADTGVTGLAILCFLGAGYTHEQGPYAAVVDRGLDWLLRQQARDGNLFGRAEPFAQMYCHAIATYALAEACGLLRNAPQQPLMPADRVEGMLQGIRLPSVALMPTVARPGLLLSQPAAADREMSLVLARGMKRVTAERLRRGVSSAARFILVRQDAESGGWRYQRGQEGDVSMLGWQLMALRSAELAGFAIPVRSRAGIQTFLSRAAQGDAGGLFGYRPNQNPGGTSTEPVTPAMTAEALFCRQMLGESAAQPSVREAVRYISSNGAALAEKNFYYWYYGSLSMYQLGGEEWEAWNGRVRELLISEQVASGPNAGSWDATDIWGRYGGRLYSTTLATLTLEVYYRLLPLHRQQGGMSSGAAGGRPD